MAARVAVVLLGLVASVLALEGWRNVTDIAGGDVPEPRFQHAMALSPNKDFAIVFGGRAAGWVDFHNDTHVLNLTSSQWIDLPDHAQAGPSDRFGMGEWTLGDYVHVFGGSTYIQHNDSSETQVVYDEVWRFHFATAPTPSTTSDFLAWEQVEVANPPKPRYAHALELVGNKLIVFGGKEVNRSEASSWEVEDQFSDTWEMDTETNTWTQIYAKINPGARHSMCSAVYSGAMYIFGGRLVFTNLTLLSMNDLWRYDPETSTWSEVQTTGDVPSPRYEASFTSYKNNLFLFGGIHSPAKGTYFWYNDTYRLDMATMVWTKLDLPTSPSERQGANGVVDDGMWLLFGGKVNHRKTEEIDYNELWALDLDKVLAGDTDAPSSGDDDESSSSVAATVALASATIFAVATAALIALF